MSLVENDDRARGGGLRRASVWERVPRLELRLGRRRLPAWTTLGRVGAAAGALVFALAGAAAGIDAILVAAVIATCVGSFAAWRAVGRRWRGGRYVLLEFAAIACGTTASVTAALGGPLAAVLDCWMIALAVCLAIGRLGCLCHGCCHGQAARRGLRYPWLPPWYVGSRWEALRLFPLQAIEASWLAAIAIAGAWLAPRAPGAAASLLPVGYAIGRFELERWRGDARRYLGPLSHNQWWCVALAVAVTALGDRAIGATGLAAIGFLLATRVHRLAPPIALSSPNDLAALGRAADRALSGEAAHAGAILIEPAPEGIRVRHGRSSLSREAARALAAVIAARGRVSG
jgi:hypothetical protein